MGTRLNKVIFSICCSVADSTWNSYVSAWIVWLNFLFERSKLLVWVSEHLVLNFVDLFMRKGYSYAHVHKTLSGISFFLKLLGCASCFSYFSVRQALKGFRKVTFRVDNRAPLSISLLRRLGFATCQVCFSPFEALLFRVAFSVCFFGAFRVSELFSKNRTCESSLKAEDVSVKDGIASVFLCYSKTDQLGKGRTVLLHKTILEEICPVSLISKYLLVRPKNAVSFFIHIDGSPLTVYQFNGVLKKCMVFLDLPNIRITSHSFRIGAATEAFRMGFSSDDIKALGGWSSNCFKRYIRPNLYVS